MRSLCARAPRPLESSRACRPHPGERPGPAAGIRKPMPDLVFLAAGLAFFALAAGYAALCARL